MKYYLILFLAVFFSSCVHVAHLNMNGEPQSPNKVAVIEVDTVVAETPVYEVNSMKNFFSCNLDSLKVSYYSRMIEVAVDNQIGQCFGIWFEPKSISKNAIVTFKAKYEGIDTLDFTAGFTDSKGGKCEDYTRTETISSSEKGFKKYEFNFSEVMGTSTLDVNKVQTVIIYLNISGKQNVKGLLTVKDIVIE